MILFYLHQSAHIVYQIGESDIERRPQYPDSPEKQSFHTLFHESKHMFDPTTFLCLVPVVFLLFIRYITKSKIICVNDLNKRIIA